MGEILQNDLLQVKTFYHFFGIKILTVINNYPNYLALLILVWLYPLLNSYGIGYINKWLVNGYEDQTSSDSASFRSESPLDTGVANLLLFLLNLDINGNSLGDDPNPNNFHFNLAEINTINMSDIIAIIRSIIDRLTLLSSHNSDGVGVRISGVFYSQLDRDFISLVDHLRCIGLLTDQLLPSWYTLVINGPTFITHIQNNRNADYITWNQQGVNIAIRILTRILCMLENYVLAN